MTEQEQALTLLKNGADLQILNGKWIVKQAPFAGYLETGLSVEEYQTKEEAIKALHVKESDVTKLKRPELLKLAKELEIEVTNNMRNEVIKSLILNKQNTQGEQND